MVKVQLKVGRKSSVWKSQAVGHPQLCKKLADADEGLDGCCTLAITVTGSPVAVCVGCTTGMETGWSFWYGEYVFTSCCGL